MFLYLLALAVSDGPEARYQVSKVYKFVAEDRSLPEGWGLSLNFVPLNYIDRGNNCEEVSQSYWSVTK